MGPQRERPGLPRLITRVPVPVRVVAAALWLAVVAFTRSGVVWTVLAPCLVLVAGLGMGHFLQTFRSPDRRPFEFGQDWIAIFAITASMLFFGGTGVLDDDPKTSTAISWTMLSVGLVLVGLCIHHLAKPVREGDEGGAT